MKAQEIWRPVVGYEGLYEVSNLGRVRSIGKDMRHKGKILKPYIMPNGYLQVTLCVNYKKKKFYIHTLVARAFPGICGKWFEGCDCNHINENKQDNRAVNIEVCTHIYNCNYGNRNKKVGEKLSKPVAQYTLEGVLIAIYPSPMEAKRQRGFDNRHICRCANNEPRYRTHKGFIWKWVKK